MQIFCFHVKLLSSGDLAWQELKQAGVQLLYSEEEEGKIKIFGEAKIETLNSCLSECPSIANAHPAQLPETDWQMQWETHAKNFREGFMHLKVLEKDIILQPGPGFGDLSHPTTKLVFELMPPYVENQLVIDVGCGSGILSLAALALGASQVIGIDIEEAALSHARKNAELNEMSSSIIFCSPEEFIPPPTQKVVLMNMISSQQLIAWLSLSPLHFSTSFLITSGILDEEKGSYLKMIKNWGFQVKEESLKEGWWGFIFTPK